MEILKTNCPQCHTPLEFPRDFDNVICAFCGAAFNVREYKGTINLSAAGHGSELLPSGADETEDRMAIIEARLGELDELIQEVGAEIEVLKSKEKSTPLQKGCSFFGLFLLVLTVIALFMPLGRKYFGNWLFYLALAVVILLGISRIRRKLDSPEQLEQLSQQRLELENGLTQLEAERSRVLKLKEEFLKLQP
jgi:LSD1 subclass zinc finger protein